MSKPIDKLMDCQHVKRWTLVATTAESTVASHSFNVAVLAMAIMRKMRNIRGTSVAEVCYYALMHDVDEAETGDIPTPTKTAIRNAGVDPNHLFDTQEPNKVPEHIARIIRLADLIDNYIFIAEHGVGTRGRAAIAEVRGRLDAALDAASEDMADAARWVWQYVEGRRSDEDEERNRIKEHNQTCIRIAEGSLRPIVGGKSRDITGNP
jgi:hypothetical protein